MADQITNPEFPAHPEADADADRYLEQLRDHANQLEMKYSATLNPKRYFDIAVSLEQNIKFFDSEGLDAEVYVKSLQYLSLFKEVLMKCNQNNKAKGPQKMDKAINDMYTRTLKSAQDIMGMAEKAKIGVRMKIRKHHWETEEQKKKAQEAALKQQMETEVEMPPCVSPYGDGTVEATMDINGDMNSKYASASPSTAVPSESQSGSETPEQECYDSNMAALMGMMNPIPGENQGENNDAASSDDDDIAARFLALNKPMAVTTSLGEEVGNSEETEEEESAAARFLRLNKPIGQSAALQEPAQGSSDDDLTSRLMALKTGTNLEGVSTFVEDRLRDPLIIPDPETAPATVVLGVPSAPPPDEASAPPPEDDEEDEVKGMSSDVGVGFAGAGVVGASGIAGAGMFPSFAPPTMAAASSGSGAFPSLGPPGGSGAFPSLGPPSGSGGGAFPSLGPPTGGGGGGFPSLGPPATGGASGFPSLGPPTAPSTSSSGGAYPSFGSGGGGGGTFPSLGGGSAFPSLGSTATAVGSAAATLTVGAATALSSTTAAPTPSIGSAYSLASLPKPPKYPSLDDLKDKDLTGQSFFCPEIVKSTSTGKETSASGGPGWQSSDPRDMMFCDCYYAGDDKGVSGAGEIIVQGTRVDSPMGMSGMAYPSLTTPGYDPKTQDPKTQKMENLFARSAQKSQEKMSLDQQLEALKKQHEGESGADIDDDTNNDEPGGSSSPRRIRFDTAPDTSDTVYIPQANRRARIKNEKEERNGEDDEKSSLFPMVNPIKSNPSTAAYVGATKKGILQNSEDSAHTVKNLTDGISLDALNLKLAKSMRIDLPADTITKFVKAAFENTKKNVETCGWLVGRKMLKENKMYVDFILLPPQKGNDVMCEATDEMAVLDWQLSKKNCMTFGWIHTHPRHNCFLSAVDLHQQCSFQLQEPMSIAIVYSGLEKNAATTGKGGQKAGIFRLTDYGVKHIQNCPKTGFHPHNEATEPLYGRAEGVSVNQRRNIRIVDFRDGGKGKFLNI